MSPRPEAMAANGRDHDDFDSDALTTDELTRKVLNRSLAMFQEIAETRAAAVRAEATAVRAEAAVDRVEKIATVMQRTFDSFVALQLGPPRRRLESLVEIDDDDPSKVQELKSVLAETAKQANEQKSKLEALQKVEDARATRHAFVVGTLKVVGLAIPVVVAAGASAWWIVNFIAKVSGH